MCEGSGRPERPCFAANGPTAQKCRHTRDCKQEHVLVTEVTSLRVRRVGQLPRWVIDISSRAEQSITSIPKSGQDVS